MEPRGRGSRPPKAGQRVPVRGAHKLLGVVPYDPAACPTVRHGPYGATMLWDEGSPLARLAAIDDAEELCRQLLASPGSWGSSTRHLEAVDLLEQVQGTGELPASFVAMMLCTCRRWDRVTNRLIAAIADSSLLGAAELDELAESFLSHEHVISYPLAWVSPHWLEVELDAGTGRTYTVNKD